MTIIRFFYLILLGTIFKTNVYASFENVHITYIDDDRSLIKKIDTTITKSARRFFHKSAHNFMNEEKKVYDVDYKKFYFINDNKDILFTINFANATQDNSSTRIPTKVLFNLKEYKDFMHSYEVYLKELVCGQTATKVCGKEYYDESIERITHQFNKFNQCMLSITSKNRIYLSEFSSLIKALSVMDRSKARIQQEINTMEKFFNEETQLEDYRRVKVSIKNFITSLDTLTN